MERTTQPDSTTYVASLLDVLAQSLGHELDDQVLEVAGGSLLGHNLNHLSAQSPLLGGLRIARLALAVGLLLGESNAEHAQNEAVRGLDVNKGLNQRSPLLDEAAKLVCGEIHA